MEAIIERCAGLDVHQASIVACVTVGSGTKKPRKEVKTFGAMTRDLMNLRDWLSEQGCTHVGMESTGVYWMPVYQILEGDFELIVGNAQHIANVPGRKTDVKDAEWIADLVRHGLIRKSFIPPQPLRDVRDLMRYRRSLVEARTSERNRLLKVLEMANIKLSSVATDVFGVSGMHMLRALADGTQSPQQMAGLAKGLLRRKLEELGLALEGKVRKHHQEILKMQLDRLKYLDADIEKLEQQIEGYMKNYERELDLLTSIPGISRLTASTILSEAGTDMTCFPSAKHLASWAGLCPGNNESAGKRMGGRIRKGNVYIKTILVQTAQTVARSKSGYFRDKFYRLKSRRGHKRAVIAMAHKMLIASYHVLKTQQPYKDLGDDYLDRSDERRTAKNLIRRLERLGYDVKTQKVTTMETEANAIAS